MLWQRPTSKGKAPSFIEKIKYDDMKGTLDVKFSSGRKYRYFKVTQEEFDELMNPNLSTGSTFHSSIKGTKKEMPL